MAAATDSSAAGSNPNADTPEKSLPGPAAAENTPAQAAIPDAPSPRSRPTGTPLKPTRPQAVASCLCAPWTTPSRTKAVLRPALEPKRRHGVHFHPTLTQALPAGKPNARGARNGQRRPP